MQEQKKILNLRRLYLDFLVIGSTSFGGFMALISVVEKQIVEKRKLISSEVLLDMISVASILPGPMAVNVVTAIGYKLAGMRGAMISMIGILLPTFVFILVLSWLYFEFGNLPEIDSVFKGILPAVCAIIVSAAINMAKKHLKDYILMIISAIGCVIFILIGGFFVNLILMVVGGLAGYLLFGRSVKLSIDAYSGVLQGLGGFFRQNKSFLISLLLVFLVVSLSIFLIRDVQYLTKLRTLFLTFSGVSITLFGGGYVFIPLLQDLVVEQFNWVTNKEFLDGIALGQITPGPIMISAAFIGFKQAGVIGSLVSTIAIFLPPAILMLAVSSIMEELKSSEQLDAILKGVRAVVIGMIFAAAWIIGRSFNTEVLPLLIFAIVFLLAYRFKVSVVFLIPVSGIVGFLLF